MSEPDVTLTDYAVAIEAAVLLILLRSGQAPTGSLATWLALFFGSVCQRRCAAAQFMVFFATSEHWLIASFGLLLWSPWG